MIGAVILYGITIAVLIGFAALALAKACDAMNLPQRYVWFAAMCAALIVPVATVLVAPQRTPSTASISTIPAHRAAVVPNVQPPAAARQTAIVLPQALSASPKLEAILSAAWLLASTLLAVIYITSWRRLTRASRSWPERDVAGQRVLVSDNIGPAVLGFLQPQIVVPAWLLDAPAPTQHLVMEHEREHIAVRDQVLLLFALMLVVLAPWNIPLWWQLRRLRFAIEVDCDARVTRQGNDPIAYGEVLLQVSRGQSGAPAVAIALIEPPSSLERRIRIMMSHRPHRVVSLSIGCAALCVSILVAAAQIDPPHTSTASLRLEPPLRSLPEQIEALVRQKYPELFAAPSAQPTLVTLRLNNDWTLESADKQSLPRGTTADEVSERQSSKDAASKFSGQLLLQDTAGSQPIFVAFAAGDGNEPALGEAQRPDAQQRKSTQRALVEHHFPQIASGSANPHELLWVLLDRSGELLATGRAASRPEPLLARLDAKYPGAGSGQRMTLQLGRLFDRPMLDVEGQPLMVTFAWSGEPERRVRGDPKTIALDTAIYRNGELVNAAPVTVRLGVPFTYQHQALRLQVTALEIGDGLIDLGVDMQVRLDQQGVEFAEAWETITRPRLRTHLGDAATIEQGVRFPNEAADVVWRVQLIPRRI